MLCFAMPRKSRSLDSMSKLGRTPGRAAGGDFTPRARSEIVRQQAPPGARVQPDARQELLRRSYQGGRGPPPVGIRAERSDRRLTRPHGLASEAIAEIGTDPRKLFLLV